MDPGLRPRGRSLLRPRLAEAVLRRVAARPASRLRYIRSRRTTSAQGGYALYDSIAFACDGAPEAAEVAGRYFQSVRQIGIGSLHIAHVNKSEQADAKPFGSSFWHNGARATWNVKLADTVPGTNQINVGLFNRKANLGALRPAVGFEVTFDKDRTCFRRIQVAEVADLAGHLSVRQRMAHLLTKGAMTAEAIADELTADVETVKRTARRYKAQFTALQGGRLALLERHAS